MKIDTNACRVFLTTDPKCRAVWEGRYDPADYEDEDPEEVEWANRVLSNARNPKKWKRTAKFGVGSKVDLEGSDTTGAGGSDIVNCSWTVEALGFTPQKGDTVREFTLEDTDHCTISLLEHSGKLYFLDDLSD